MTPPGRPGPGRVLTALALGAGLWLVVTVALGGVLAGPGWWVPWVGWPVAVLAACGAGLLVHRLPGVALTRGSALALVALCVGFAVYAGVTRSEHVLPRRDAASNLQAAVSLATTHQRVVPVEVSAIAGTGLLESGEVTAASAAFYQVGSPAAPAVQPQFLMAPAVVYGFGVWAGGPAAAQVLPAVVMAVVLLLLGLFAAHLTRAPWWGVAAAALSAALFPVLNVARGTYSEQLALVTLVGGLLAVTLAVGREDPGGARLALLGGVLVGGTGLARIDSLREVLLLVPLLAVGAALRMRWVRPALVGLLLAAAGSLALAWALSYRYLGDIHESLVPLLVMAVLAGLGSSAGLWLWRTGRRPAAAALARAPAAGAAIVVLAGLLLWSRPWWMTVRQDPDDPGARYVAGMQRRQGLPVDGGRTYAEHTVDWLSWYVGWVALVIALGALALLVRLLLRRLVAGQLVGWGPALVVAAGSSLLTLLRPGITPDHPWADRRLLIALALVVLLVVVAGAWAVRRLPPGRSGAGAAVAGVTVLCLAVPAVPATWPFRGAGVERGSLGAVDAVCAQLRPGDLVLGIDSRAGAEWPQPVRGMCGVSMLAVTTPVREDPGRRAEVVAELAAAAAARGHRLVLLAADGPEVIEELGLDPVPVVDIRFREEEHALERRPVRTDLGGIRVSLAPVPVR